MNRKLLLASVLSLTSVVVLGALAFVLFPGATSARPEKGRQDEPQAQVTQLPIGQVVLFSSGVGYFQREGQIEGNARVDLSFPVSDINDLIKSMVLRDMNGGHISAVSYDSNAPIEKTLKSFALNLTANPSFGQILNQARGEKVEVVLQQTNATQPGTMSGTLVGIEKQKQAVGKDVVEGEMLNLWCADGLRCLKMSEIQRVRFLNPIMDSEFRKALETLAQSHDTQKKAVSIHFTGDGKREVRVGYVIENPIWKTSYRLVLDKKEAPYLQGWAVVENPSDEDWKDVRMALVSGRPISFQMDLYQPLYVPRPTVELELFASLRPVAYSGAMNARELARAARPQEEEGERLAAGDGLRKTSEKGAALGRAKDKAPEAQQARRGLMASDLNDRLDLGKSGVTSVADASKLGDFFQYLIAKPVSLSRQKSALLPIVNKDVEGTRVSIYNERTQAKFPLLGLKFKNTSGLHLMQGPITVFEGSNYAGDARIFDLQPNEERLLSYAVDLGTEVNPVSAPTNGRITSVKAVKGIIYSSTKVRESKSYTIKNRNDAERLVLVEHPVRNDFKLVDTDKPAETASDFYRFQLKVAPGKTETTTVTEERVVNNQVAITNSGDDQIRFFINETVSSPKVKEALQKALNLRWEQNKTTREIAELQRQLNIITTDQTRLRANLKETPGGSPLAKRYLDKLNEQETQIEQYQAEVKRLQGVEHTQKKAFEDYIGNINAE
jgi:hypothetical protein